MQGKKIDCLEHGNSVRLKDQLLAVFRSYNKGLLIFEFTNKNGEKLGAQIIIKNNFGLKPKNINRYTL